MLRETPILGRSKYRQHNLSQGFGKVWRCNFTLLWRRYMELKISFPQVFYGETIISTCIKAQLVPSSFHKKEKKSFAFIYVFVMLLSCIPSLIDYVCENYLQGFSTERHLFRSRRYEVKFSDLRQLTEFQLSVSRKYIFFSIPAGTAIQGDPRWICSAMFNSKELEMTAVFYHLNMSFISFSEVHNHPN